MIGVTHFQPRRQSPGAAFFECYCISSSESQQQSPNKASFVTVSVMACIAHQSLAALSCFWSIMLGSLTALLLKLFPTGYQQIQETISFQFVSGFKHPTSILQMDCPS
ncbi:hypothetical protein TNCT_541351 [Trichonephila clavata]|uniref:Uncharacterized protein n=1 Tax=Trichonephila clavata TaxID=2740835 RepID=A0A8X6G220_TRICU|nr:hypothetical protein TNCT_541351 [Trichonephila clavata]